MKKVPIMLIVLAVVICAIGLGMIMFSEVL